MKNSGWKKFKLNKKFRALPVDEKDEFFVNGIFEFNITKLIDFIEKNPDHFLREQIKILEFPKWDSDNLDEVTVASANLSAPIILAEMSPGRFNVIDGNHRLENARRDGVVMFAIDDP